MLSITIATLCEEHSMNPKMGIISEKKNFFTRTSILKIDYNQADEDACKMEHAVSPATLVAFANFTEFY